jgi:hypothetical protein
MQFSCPTFQNIYYLSDHVSSTQLDRPDTTDGANSSSTNNTSSTGLLSADTEGDGDPESNR